MYYIIIEYNNYTILQLSIKMCYIAIECNYVLYYNLV